MFQAEIDGVDQCRHAARLGESDAFFQSSGVRRETGYHRWFSRDCQQLEFVIWIRCAEESPGYFPGLAQCWLHAAADVQYQTHRTGSILLRERHDPLWPLIVEDMEIVGPQRF
jgi:hypothetical protein